MIAYKFLGSDCTGRFSGFAWPLPDGGSPGEWVESPLSRCASGVHACRVRDLPFWVDATLWRIELAGTLEEASRKVVASRGRLLKRIEAWDAGAMRDFGLACVERVAPLAGRSPGLQAGTGRRGRRWGRRVRRRAHCSGPVASRPARARR